MRRRERSRVHGSRGIAEVVGTLMLILIVVAASIALAAFVASYQKQLQSEQAEAQQRSLESLKVLNLAQVNAQPSPNNTKLANFSFILASEFVNPSTISSLSVNGNPLRFFAVTPLAPDAGPANCSFNSTTPLTLAPFAEVEITVNTNASSTGLCGYSFFSTSLSFPIDEFVQIGIFTILQNTFTTVFLPPTAVPLVTTLAEFSGGGSSTGFVNVPVLDGANSFQAGNGTLTSWDWFVTNTTAGSNETWTAGGEQLVAPFVSTGYGHVYTYSIALTVEDSNELLGISTIDYTYHP
jgi:flagellin-like protein